MDTVVTLGRILADIPAEPGLNHRLSVRGGMLEDECAEIMKGFFALRRGERRNR